MGQFIESRYDHEESQREDFSYTRANSLPLHGQKAQEQRSVLQEPPTPGQRLTLAIFSLLLLSLLSIIALAIVGSRIYDSNINNTFFFTVLGIVLLVLALAIVIINAIFHRK